VDYTATGGTFGRGVVFTAGAGADTVYVRGTSAGGPTLVYGWDGNDTSNVSSDGTVAPAGTLDRLAGPLYVEGNAGADRLAASEYGSAAADPVTLTANAITGTATPFSIVYTATGGTFGNGVAFTNSRLFGTVNVQGTVAGGRTWDSSDRYVVSSA